MKFLVISAAVALTIFKIAEAHLPHVESERVAFIPAHTASDYADFVKANPKP